MNNTRIQQLKAQETFKKWDIAVYVLLFACIVLLFWVFVFAKEEIALTGIEAYYEDKTAGDVRIFTYDYAQDEYDIHQAWQDRISVAHNAQGIAVTVSTDGGGYNVLHISREGEAYMEDANCSYRKDCVHFDPITKGDTVILCVPHRLMILGVGGTGPTADQDLVIG